MSDENNNNNVISLHKFKQEKKYQGTKTPRKSAFDTMFYMTDEEKGDDIELWDNIIKRNASLRKRQEAERRKRNNQVKYTLKLPNK